MGQLDELISQSHAIPAKDRIEQLGNVSLKKKETSKEGTLWKGPCPFCGGTDRFVVNERTGRWWCRKNCTPFSTEDHWGDGLDFVKGLPSRPQSLREAIEIWTGQIVIDKAHVDAVNQQRKEAEAAEEAKRQEKRQKMLARIAGGALWDQFSHMTPEQSELWLSRGITEGFQKSWKLGYVQDLWHDVYRVPKDKIEDTPDHREALVIPYSNSEGYAQFRYRVPNGRGTYHNLSLFEAVPFITQPGRLFDQVIIHEGAIKAMNGFIYGAGEKWQVIGASSMTNFNCMVDLLRQTRRVAIWFDPDTWIKPSAANEKWLPAPIKLANLLRQSYKDLEIRVVKTAFKSDDAQLAGLDQSQYLGIINGARRLEAWPKKF